MKRRQEFGTFEKEAREAGTLDALKEVAGRFMRGVNEELLYLYEQAIGQEDTVRRTGKLEIRAYGDYPVQFSPPQAPMPDNEYKIDATLLVKKIGGNGREWVLSSCTPDYTSRTRTSFSVNASEAGTLYWEIKPFGAL
jgi:hypothetical protein